MRRKVGMAVAVICGLELAIALAIGGAGASLLFGWEGLVVTLALGVVAVETARRRRLKPTETW